MNTLRLAEDTYIDKGKMVRQTPKKTEQAWSRLGTVVADNDQSTKVSETAKYGQQAYSRLLMPHLYKLWIG
jgi:hypothetical protein